jgi:hypothetical protein
MRNLGVGHGDAREMRDAANGGLIHGHIVSSRERAFRKTRCYSIAPFALATRGHTASRIATTGAND